MKKDALPGLARQCLTDLLDQPGSLLYSGHETLRPGPVYLLGFNPGGSDGDALEKSIGEMLGKTANSYLDEDWGNGMGEFAAGKAPLQKRIAWLLQEIGLEPREVCASNLIFLKSRRAVDISYALADRCWPVHEAILDIVQPRLVLAFGNSALSPYGYLHAKYGGEEASLPAGHGRWRVKGFRCVLRGREVYVAGLPHLSRYSPVGKTAVVAWLRAALGGGRLG